MFDVFSQIAPMIPCVLHEDEHLLVVDKPAGLNTHAPAPFAGEGLYDWLRHREARWATLAILHRLDKETSGVMVFGKTPVANKSLTEQFTQRDVHKKYLLLTDRPVPQREFTVKSALARVGEKYASVVGQASRLSGEAAETHFRVVATWPPVDSGEPTPDPSQEGIAMMGAGDSNASAASGRLAPVPLLGGVRGGSPQFTITLLEAEPRTGRTHQIRVHAAEAGFPILGDTLYGGFAGARVFLHAAELSFQHPATGAECVFCSASPFASDAPHQSPNLARRLALIDPAETNACRLLHGASDGWPGWYVERLGDFLLSQSGPTLTAAQTVQLRDLLTATGTLGVYHKILNRQIRRAASAEASPQLVLGSAAPERFTIRENGVHFELSFAEGYSVGLFLDQRDNRRRFLTGHIAADFPLLRRQTLDAKPEILNTFAYTCGFSVAAALGGARVTSLDLSKKYLDWGRRNFALNGLDPAQHDFIFGDTFDWLRRLAKKGRTFDAIVLDPPTFSQSKESGVFRAEKDYGRLVTAALGVLKPGGVLLASTNAAEWPPEEFVATVKAAVVAARRRVTAGHFVPQPPDFPITRTEPGYLKTLWVRAS